MANSKVIDVILQLKDKMTGPMSAATKKLQANANQYKRIGRDMQRTGKKIASAGATLTKTITAPLVALGAVAYKEFGEYDKQMRLVQQTMGATAEESEMLGNTIKEAAQNSVYGMQDAADAALNYARAGYDAKQAADMIAPAFNLAAGTATDLSVVTAGLSSTMKAFDADSSEAATYTDVLAKAQAQAATTVTDLFDSTAKASAMFKTAGWNISDLATATGVLGDAYISGAEAGTALKSGMSSLVKPETINYMKKLGIEITNADGTFKSFADTQEILHNAFEGMTPVMKTQAATAIFGKHQLAKWLKIIERSPQDIRSMESALGGATNTAQDMSDALMEGPGGAIEKLKSNWDIFKKTLGETIAPVITPLIEKLTEMMQAFSSMTDEQKESIVKMAAFAAAAGPVLLVVGKLFIGIGDLVEASGKLGTAFKAGTGIFKVFAGVSKGAMVGGLGAIVLAIGVLIRNWDKIKEKISSFYQKIKPALDKIVGLFQKVFGWISDLIDSVAMPALDAVLGAIGGIIDVLGGVVDFITGIFTGDWEKAWEGIKEIFEGIWNGIKDIVIGVINAIIEAINWLLDRITDLGNGLKNLLIDFGLNMSPGGAMLDEDDRQKMKDALSFEIPHIPTLGVGTKSWGGGFAQISERGGEIVDLPTGSRVYPHDESVKQAYRDGVMSSQNNNVSIKIPKLADQIVVREGADIDRIATRLAHKLEKVSQNVGNSRIDYSFQS